MHRRIWVVAPSRLRAEQDIATGVVERLRKEAAEPETLWCTALPEGAVPANLNTDELSRPISIQMI